MLTDVKFYKIVTLGETQKVNRVSLFNLLFKVHLHELHFLVLSSQLLLVSFQNIMLGFGYLVKIFDRFQGYPLNKLLSVFGMITNFLDFGLDLLHLNLYNLLSLIKRRIIILAPFLGNLVCFFQ